MASFSTLDSAGAVRSPLDEDSLKAFLNQVLSVPSASVVIQQFGHGQSNPTYLVSIPNNGPSSITRRLVLRKKPDGKILSSAHAVEREYAVISALHRMGLRSPANAVPVPRPVAMCDDAAVLGTPFFLMDFAEGAIYLVSTCRSSGVSIKPALRNHLIPSPIIFYL